MSSPHCASPTTVRQPKSTALGYQTFQCAACRRRFYERIGSPFNFLEYPTDVVLLVVLWRLRYSLSLRNLAEIFLERGFVFTHEAVREWEERFAPLLAERLHAKRRGKARRSWYVDETYIKVHGRWCYLYRVIARDGYLVDSLLSESRDRKAAQRFFRGAREVVGQTPDRVTTDGHEAYPRAIRRTLGRKVAHRRNRYLTIRMEQDHRSIKQRYYPMRGFGRFEAAARFCTAHDELRDYLQPQRAPGEAVSLAQRRRLFRDRWSTLVRSIAA